MPDRIKNLELAKYLRALGIFYLLEFTKDAIRVGNLKIMKFFKQISSTSYGILLLEAARY